MGALLYFMIMAGLIFLIMRFGCGAHVMGQGSGRNASAGSPSARANEDLRWIAPATDIDPVCGKTVRTDRAKPSVHDGTVYYFCSRDCRELFETAPQLYLGRGALVPITAGENDDVRHSERT